MKKSPEALSKIEKIYQNFNSFSHSSQRYVLGILQGIIIANESPEIKDFFRTVKDAFAAKNESSSVEHLALQISALLKNPELPVPIYNGLVDGISDLVNSHINQKELIEREESAEHIADILRGYQVRKTEAENV